MYSKSKMTIVITIIGLVMIRCGQPGNESRHAEKEIHDEQQHIHGSETKPDNLESTNKPKSPKTSAMANIGDNHIHIEYGAPSVRGRVIWGGLVPYGEVWASGAHKATFINFSQNVKVGSVELPKGKYAFFTIPGEETWTVIINKNWDQHLADEYDEKEDMLRLTVVPEENSFVEALKYSVVPVDDNKGFIHFEWEKLILSIEIVNI